MSNINASDFSITIRLLHEDAPVAIEELPALSSSVTSWQFTASPFLEEDVAEVETPQVLNDGAFIDSEDPDFDEEEDEDCDPQDYEPSNVLLVLTPTAQAIKELKHLWSIQDSEDGVSVEILVSQQDEDGKPIFYHAFQGYLHLPDSLGAQAKPLHRSEDHAPLTIALNFSASVVKLFELTWPGAISIT